MKYLADSVWVVDYLIGKQQAIDLFTSVSQDGIAISLITFGEILRRNLLWPRPPTQRGDISAILAFCRCASPQSLKVQFPSL